MSEKMMDEFKEWAYAASLDVWSASNGDGEPEYFMCYDTEICWQAWQASRAALVVELPSNCKGMAITVDELRVMMKKIGVIIK